jgi:hypothetical protein
MGTGSTKDDVFSAFMKKKIADQMYTDFGGSAQRSEIHDSVDVMDDQELFRRAMMYGLLDENAGENR